MADKKAPAKSQSKSKPQDKPQQAPPSSMLIHQFLTQHPVGRAIAAHTGYGPGHAVHDIHAVAAGPHPAHQPVNPTLTRTPSGPLNPILLQQMMQQQGPMSQMAPPGSPLPMPPPGAMPPGMPGR